MLLTDILQKTVLEYPDKLALIMRMGYRTVRLSYQEVYDWSVKVACLLQQQGIKKGDKVLLMAPNSPYWICLFWGCLLNGSVVVPLNTQSTPDLVQKIAKQTGAKILFKPLHDKRALPKGVESHDIELLPEELENVDGSGFKKHRAKLTDIVQILYTSGTTAAPKGVILSHQNICSNMSALQQLLTLSCNDYFLSILPLSHILEQVGGFLVPFQYACTIVYTHSPAAIVDLLREHRITIMVGVPQFLDVVMSKIEAKAKEKGKLQLLQKTMAFSYRLPFNGLRRLLFRSIHKQFGGKLHTVVSGGAPLDPDLERKWNALGITLLQGYGLTETAGIVSVNSYSEHRMKSVGKPMPGVQVKISNAGEILVKGANVYQGYFKNAEKTRAAFTADGWFKTDDLGEQDEDGFLYLKGRQTYMILGPGGQNIYPEDIELELNKMTGVKASCVVGLERAGGKVEIHAVILLDPQGKSQRQKAKKIIAEANQKLSSYQQIMGWSLWPEEDFPRSLTKKVKKHEVLRFLAQQQKRRGRERAVPKTQLMHLLGDITGTKVDQIRPRSNLVRDLHLDSLSRVELVARIEEQFGIIIDEAKIDAQTTVSDIDKLIKTGHRQAKQRFRSWPLSWWASLLRILIQYLIAFPYLRLFLKLEVEGLKNLEGLSLPVIFMPNHISFIDPALIAKAIPFPIRRRLAMAAAQDILYIKYRSFAWLNDLSFNSFPFPRKEGQNIKFGLDYMGRMIDRDQSILIFPEGKIYRIGHVAPLKQGAGFVAVEMACWIVPVKITDLDDVLPTYSFVPKGRGTVKVTFGKALRFSRSDSYIEATERIGEALEAL